MAEKNHAFCRRRRLRCSKHAGSGRAARKAVIVVSDEMNRLVED